MGNSLFSGAYNTENRKPTMDINKINILGASTSVFILAICSLIFIFRLNNQPKIEYWLGVVFILTSFPLFYLLISTQQFPRPPLYYIQIGTMTGFIIIELLLDYIFKVDFRNTRWMTITYVMLFFSGTGGMIGIATHAGKLWAILAIVLFFVMTTLAFIQHARTGM